MSKKWIALMIIGIAAMISSGCATVGLGGISNEGMMAYQDAKDTFMKAKAANAKECAPAQYARAEAYLALAEEEIAEKDEFRGGHFHTAVKTVKEKSLEALKLCEPKPVKAAAPPKPAPPKERCQPLIPETVKPGECYARILLPELYQTFTERVLTRQASFKIETIPAKYETVEQKVLVKEASKRYEEVPAEYGWVEEKVLVEAARTEWKKGRGLIEKVDNATGEIMCLVEVPAKYETVRRQVVTKPASIRVIDIPAEYETVKVTKMVSPPQEKRIPIPEEYGTVTRREKVADSCLGWTRVLCETNMSPQMVMKVQEALSKAGYSPGPIDGTYGSQTRAAVTSYQKAKGLGEGELTYETMESLGVKVD